MSVRLLSHTLQHMPTHHVQPSDDEMEKFEVELRKPLGMTIAGLVHPDTGGIGPPYNHQCV